MSEQACIACGVVSDECPMVGMKCRDCAAQAVATFFRAREDARLEYANRVAAINAESEEERRGPPPGYDPDPPGSPIGAPEPPPLAFYPFGEDPVTKAQKVAKASRRNPRQAVNLVEQGANTPRHSPRRT